MAKRIKGSNVQAVITDGKVTGLAVNGNDINAVTLSQTSSEVLFKTGGGVVRLGEKSRAYCTFLPCDGLQGSGGPLDYSEVGNSAFLRSAYVDDGAGPWSSVGYLKTIAGTDKFVQLPGTSAQIDSDKHSVLLQFTLNLAASATDPVGLISWGTVGGTTKGLYLSKSGSNTLRVGVNKGAGGASIGFSTKVIADATDHTITVLQVAKSNDVYVWIDGVLDLVKLSGFTGSYVTDPAVQIAIGGIPDTTFTGAASYDGLYKNIHILKWEGYPPTNILQIVKHLVTYPSTPIKQSEIGPQAASVRLLCIIGQSNEQGAGETKGTNIGFGAPHRDPIAPNGSASNRSMWPRLVERMAKERGIWTKVYNTAIGGTAAIDNWCGCIRPYVNGMFCSAGLYVLSGGYLWKSNQPTSGVGAYLNASVAPVGASNTTGADTIPWVNLGVPTASDVAGVLAEGHPRFDPRGLLGGANGPAIGLAANIADQKWTLVQFGQNDSLCVKNKEEFKSAYRNITNYLLARGSKVSLGISCYNNSSIDVAYQTMLIPAVEELLLEFSDNPNVVRGANLRTALGVLPTATYRGMVGLKSTDASPVHMNDMAYKVASDAVFDAYTLVGW